VCKETHLGDKGREGTPNIVLDETKQARKIQILKTKKKLEQKNKGAIFEAMLSCAEINEEQVEKNLDPLRTSAKKKEARKRSKGRLRSRIVKERPRNSSKG
jgi:hypothetical protein